jgi:hypothetical protein
MPTTFFTNLGALEENLHNFLGHLQVYVETARLHSRENLQRDQEAMLVSIAYRHLG